MKKSTAIILSLLLPVLTWGQVQINTKKVKIGDFTQKITKVVLTGNQFLDGTLQDEVTLRWRISPYEFCTLEEFDKIKTDDNYYFLMTTNARFKKDSSPSLQFLTLVKGGPDADEGIHEMLEVVSIPIASARFPSGRELIFLPAFLDIIQDYTLNAMENDQKGYGGLSIYAENIRNSDNCRIVFSETDINENVGEMERKLYFTDNMSIESEEEADSHLINNDEGYIISYSVAPFEAQNGAYCYKMLIDSGSHKLYYFKKEKISGTRGPGFLPDDIKKLFKGNRHKRG